MNNFNFKIISGVLLLAITALIFMLINNNKEISKCNYRNENLKEEVKFLNEKVIESIRNCDDRVEELQTQLGVYKSKENDRIKAEKDRRKSVNYRAVNDIELRENPDSNSTIISYINKNEIVGLLTNQPYEHYEHSLESLNDNYWWRVSFNNVIGWVIYKYTYTDYLSNIGNGIDLPKPRKTRENLLKVQ